MRPDVETELAQKVEQALSGKYWEVAAQDWWVVVQGVTTQQLIVLTNDPLGIDFRPLHLNSVLEKLRDSVFQDLYHAGLICDDGSWNGSLYD